MASASSDIDVALEELEARLERLRALYEQYFIGIEKIEPSVPRQDVDRRIYALRKVQIRNTAKRFKLQTIIQRYNAFQQYWLRICREIENGTYHRHVARAQSRFGDVPLTAAARRRARLQTQHQTDEQKAAVEEKARARKATDDDLEALLGEDLDVALSRALLAADDVEIARVEPATPVAPAKPAIPVQLAPVTIAEVPPPKVAPSVAPPRPKASSPVEAAAPGKALPSRPPPRAKPALIGATPETSAAPPPRAGMPAAPPARSAPARAEAPAANPSAKKAAAPARPAPGALAPGVPGPVGAAAAAVPPAAAGVTRRADVGAPAAPAAAAPSAAAAPAAAAGPPVSPVDAKTRPGRAKDAASPKAKPAAAAAKAPAREDAWAALRMPPGQRPVLSPQATGAKGASAAHPAHPTQGTAPGAPVGKSPPKAEPARGIEASKPTAPAGSPAQPIPAPSSPSTGVAGAKKAEPKPVRVEVAPRAAPQVAPAAPAPRSAEPEAPAAPPADARATAAAARAAAARAAELRSQTQATPQGAGLDDQRLSQLHGALVAERRRLNQPGKVSRDALAASLRDTESKLRKQYGDKQIDFHVVIKDGKAVVKPIVG